MHLIIADHTLKNFQGHSFEYCKSIREIALSMGWKVSVLGISDISTEAKESLQAEPFFKYGFFHHFPLPGVCRVFPESSQKHLWGRWNFLQHNASLEKDLCKLIPICNNSEKTLILFPTFGFNDLLGITKFAERLDCQSRVQVALVKHFTSRPNLSKDMLPHPLYKKCFDYLKKSHAKDRMHFFADSNDLIDEYLYYFEEPMKIVPIPHTSEPDISSIPQDKPLVIGYMGDARTNKGFHYIPEAIEFARRITKTAFHCEIQANIRNHPEWQVRQAVRLLQEMPYTSLYHEALNSDEYKALMKRIDIFVLPYTLEHYHSQTSGVFSEARALGKVTVVSRGTWMAREVQEQGGGLLAIPEDSKSLGDAIAASVENYGLLRTRALECATNWGKYHNCKSFINELIAGIPGMSN